MERRQEQRHATLLAQLVDVLEEILTERDFDSAELFSCVLKIVWGAWLLLPMDTFGSSPGFAAMAWVFGTQHWVAPEAIWGLLVTLAGANHLYALATRKYSTRRWASLVGIGIWSAVAVMVGIGNPNGTGVIVYGALACSNAWAYWRLGLKLRV